MISLNKKKKKKIKIIILKKKKKKKAINLCFNLNLMIHYIN